MKKYVLLFLCILISCSEKNGKKLEKDVAKQEKKTYFEFDEIVHYNFPYTDDQLVEIWEKEHLSKSEKDLQKILVYNYPETISDTTFISRVEKFHPEKTRIDSTKFEELRKIFSERNRKEDDESSSCKLEYRNILVFKKKGTITGITKLCFHCQRFYIIGTNRNTDNFGQAGDWLKLEKLIAKRPSANSG